MTLDFEYALGIIIIAFLLGILIGRATKKRKSVFPHQVAEEAYIKGMADIYKGQGSVAYRKQQAEKLALLIKDITGIDPSRPMPSDEE